MNIRASYHQERIWFIDSFERKSLYENGPIYHNIPLILRVEGQLEPEYIKKSMNCLMKKHEILRTKVITVKNTLYQDIADVEKPYLEIKKWTESKEESEYVIEYLKTVNEEAFKDGIDKQLFKGFYLKLNDAESYLLFSIHHLICDEISKGKIKKDFINFYSALYNHEIPDTEMPSLQYADFSEWQRNLSEIILESNIIYWKKKLNKEIKVLELAMENERAAIHIYKPETYILEIPNELLYKVEKFHQNYSVNKRIIFLAAFKILLMKYSGNNEVNIGTSIDNRINENLLDVVGPIANLVLLSDNILENTSYLDVIEQVNSTYKEAVQNSLIPFDKLVMEMKPKNDMSRTAFFDVLFNFIEDNKEKVCKLFDEIELNLGWGKYDYNLLIKEYDGKIKCYMTYNKLYFTEEIVTYLMNNYLLLCKNLIDNPILNIGDVECITENEKNKLISVWNNKNTDNLTDECIHDIFSKQAKIYPDNIAVKDGNNTITYSQLEEKSNQLAMWLRNNKVFRNDIIAIIMEKSIECIITILGILKAGGCYLPIDPGFPDERINYILNDSCPKLIITNIALSKKFENKSVVVSIERILCDISTNIVKFTNISRNTDLAYIIYTSGTTGNPKGMMIEHKNVAHLIKYSIPLFNFSSEDIWTFFHSYNFDFSVWEMYGALLTGGKLLIVTKSLAKDTKQFKKILEDENVTILNQTPSAFYILSNEEMADVCAGLNLRYIIFGGEALNVSKLSGWKEKYPKATLINMYGITETTVHVTFKEISNENIQTGTNSIGKPLPTYSTYVMDSSQRLVPIGVKGELVVGGSGVGRGYLNLPELTKEKFIEDPFCKEGRLYRSGDLVRYKFNGELEYLGRIDNQVKIRGFRIETGEIETVLIKHEAVREAVVSLKKDAMGTPELIGYIIFKEGETTSSTILRDYMKIALPDYMIPAKFIKIDEIPVTENGKIDYKKLLSIEQGELDLGIDYVEAETKIQKKLVEIWSGILGINQIGINDNFFYLGGNSLMVTKMVFLINEEFNVEIPYKYIFSKPTIKSLDCYLCNIDEDIDLEDQNIINFEKEMMLDNDIDGTRLSYKEEETEKQKILLTGATGFLGAYLLKDIIKSTTAVVYCLVRANSEQEAENRIYGNLSYYLIDKESMKDRVIPIVGDLEKPFLGISRDKFETLADEVDTVFHNGAIARQGFSYEQLEKANVSGTKEILRFVVTNRLKNLHYISTLSVFGATVKPHIYEKDIPDYENQMNIGGYESSKIVAEALIREARKRNVRANIYRLGRICGDTITGACQTNDLLWQIIKADIEAGSISNGNMTFDMIPVNMMSEAILKIALNDNERNNNYHIYLNQPLKSEDLYLWLKDFGYSVELDNDDVWLEKVKIKAKISENSMCSKLLPVLTNSTKQKTTVSYFDDTQTRKYCNGMKQYSIQVNEDIFKKTIKFFQKREYL